MTTLLPIILLQPGVGSLCSAENRLMEASSGSDFPASCGMMDRLGPSIFWLPMLIGGGIRSSTSQNLSSVSGGYSDSISINWNRPARFLPIYHRRIFDNTRSAPHAPVTISLWRPVRAAYKSPLLVVTPYEVFYLIIGMTTWTIDVIYLFVNNFCG